MPYVRACASSVSSPATEAPLTSLYQLHRLRSIAGRDAGHRVSVPGQELFEGDGGMLLEPLERSHGFSGGHQRDLHHRDLKSQGTGGGFAV